MFLALFLGGDSHVDRAQRVLRAHTKKLTSSRWVGAIRPESICGGFVAWDRESSHSAVIRNEEQATLLVRGGYLAGEDEWLDSGLHTSEMHGSWGEFAAVLVRSLGDSTVTVSAFSDPAGSWPLYWARRDDSVVVTNDPLFAALALDLAELSEQTSYELLAYGHALGPGSTIQGVTRLMPGERITVQARASGVLSVDCRREMQYSYSERKQSTDVFEDLTLDGLRMGVASIPPFSGGGLEHATIQLSGGLDSRLTAAVLAEIFAQRPHAVTLDLSDSAELEIADNVSRLLGFPHRIESLAPADEEMLYEGWMLTGGQVSPYAAAGNILSYETAQVGPQGQVLLVGAWPGDCLIGSYVPLVPGMKSKLLRPLVIRDWAGKRGRRHYEIEKNVVGRDRRRVARRARRRIVKDVIGASGSTAAQSISYWGMFTRQPNFSYIAPAMLTAHVLPITPVLARPYLERLLQLQAADILGKRFYRMMISRGYPHVAEVPIAATGRPATDPAPGVVWLPRTVEEFYVRLPRAVQYTAHLVLGWIKTAKVSGEVSAEDDHWSRVLGSDTDSVMAGSLEFRASSRDELHVRSVVRALRWTSEYLVQGRESFGDW